MTARNFCSSSQQPDQFSFLHPSVVPSSTLPPPLLDSAVIQPESVILHPVSMVPQSQIHVQQQTTPAAQQDLLIVLAGIIQTQQQQIDLQRQQLDVLIDLQRRAQPAPGVKEFREMHPSSFSGMETPLQSEEWLRSTNDNLLAARIPVDDWVSIAKLQLTDNARHWWDAELTRLVAPISWETFTERFNARYFPRIAKIALEKQFIALK